MYLHPLLSVGLSTLDVFQVIMGAFMAYTLHLVVHVVQAILFRGYIPALATSLICLPISLWIIYSCWPILMVSPAQSIVAVPLGILLTALNLRFAQSLIPRFSND